MISSYDASSRICWMRSREFCFGDVAEDMAAGMGFQIATTYDGFTFPATSASMGCHRTCPSNPKTDKSPFLYFRMDEEWRSLHRLHGISLTDSTSRDELVTKATCQRARVIGGGVLMRPLKTLRSQPLHASEAHAKEPDGRAGGLNPSRRGGLVRGGAVPGFP